MNTADSVERRARALYRQSCQRLDADSLRSLQRARLDAVAAQAVGNTRRLLVPLGAVAASILAVAVTWTFLPARSQYDASPRNEGTYGVTRSGNADAEMYQDLEFYRWLARHAEQAPARN